VNVREVLRADALDSLRLTRDISDEQAARPLTPMPGACLDRHRPLGHTKCGDI
jgi:hypothetical protein